MRDRLNVKPAKLVILSLLLLFLLAIAGQYGWRRNVCMLALIGNGLPHNEPLPLSLGGVSHNYRDECDLVSAYLVPHPVAEDSDWTSAITFHQGAMRWQDGNEDGALAIWRQEPMIGVYWYNQGQIALQQQSIEQANNQFGLAWHLSPDHHQARIAFALAKSHAQLGQIEDALFYYREAASVSSSLPVEAEYARRAEWQAAMLSEDYAYALTLARERAEQNPSDALSWISLAQVFLAMEHPLEAIGPLERALELSYNDNEVRYLLARAYREAGDQQGSHAQLQWVEESQRDWNYYVQLALTLGAAGCRESAQAQWHIAQAFYRSLGPIAPGSQEEVRCTLSGYR